MFGSERKSFELHKSMNFNVFLLARDNSIIRRDPARFNNTASPIASTQQWTGVLVGDTTNVCKTRVLRSSYIYPEVISAS